MKTKKINIAINQFEIERNRDLTNRFAAAMCEMELADIENLLHEDYTYHDLNKIEFLKWLDHKFTENFKNEVFFMPAKIRYCMSCKPGNPVLLFNQGFFPKEVDGYSGPKGFMLEFREGKISGITICFSWCIEKDLYYFAANN